MTTAVETSARKDSLHRARRAVLGAVLADVEARRPLVVLQAPPGSGKTHVLLRAAALAQHRGLRVAVATQTNNQADDLCRRLRADGGQESRCDWLEDEFGLSWQIVPSNLGELLKNRDRAKAQRAQQALLAMNKLDIQALREA